MVDTIGQYVRDATSFGQSKQGNMWNCSQSNENSMFFYERVLEGKVECPPYYFQKY